MNLRFFIPIALLIGGVSGCGKSHSAAMNQQDMALSSQDNIKDEPISAATHYAAGQLAEARGDFNNAIGQYRAALAVDPKFTQATYRLGCSFAEAKRYPESIETWHQYLTATNNASAGYSNLAYTEELTGNPAGAEADYKRGIAKDPTNEACRVNYGLMLARHGRVGDATIQLQSVLAPAEVHYNLATVYEFEHRNEMAKLEYQQAIALDPNFAEAREKLASLGDYSEQD